MGKGQVAVSGHKLPRRAASRAGWFSGGENQLKEAFLKPKNPTKGASKMATPLDGGPSGAAVG